MARTLGGFGRIPSPPDERDGHFLMRVVAPQIRAAAAPSPRKRPYLEPIWRLNQGNTPHCVAFAGKGFVLAAPITQDPGYDPVTIYNECQKADEWDGENYDGTSVRALMKVLTTHKWISGYVWGQTIDEATAWMDGGYGTIVIGSNWYLAMDEVGSDGFIKSPKTTDTPIGGHAYRINWYDTKKDGYLVFNSWGNEWGIPILGQTTFTGTGYLRRADLERLLREDGEVASATQVKIKAVKL